MSNTITPPPVALVQSPAPEVLTITVQHTQPIELSLLTSSLQALATQHARYADRHGAAINGDQVKLYVKEIRGGSIVVELVALATSYGPIVGEISTVVGFAKSLVGILDFFRGKADALPPETGPKDVDDTSTFIEVGTGSVRDNVIINASDNAQVVVNYTLPSEAANAAQNRMLSWASQQAIPVTGVHTGVLFYFVQARDEASARAGDKGRVESISPAAVKTLIMDPAIKAVMLDEALFRKIYVVDVSVETVGGRPRLYKILKLHDSMGRTEA